MKLSADYRALALDALRGRWKTAVLAGLIASLLGANIVSSSDRVISNMSQNANGDTPRVCRAAFHRQRRRAGGSRDLHPCLGSVYRSS